jgi:hypothetical protein
MSSKPVLFLDIDGVLNSARWFEKSISERGGVNATDWAKMLDPECCIRLRHVLLATRCDVVLSSSWRSAHGNDDVAAFIASRGCPISFIGATPEWRSKHGSVVAGYETRGAEIQAWLLAQNPERTGPIAIVDDCNDMGPLGNRLVRTDREVGLQDANVIRLIFLLRGAR